MKVLVVADEESKSLWDFYTPGKLKGIDLIISCGDLSPDYLEFLVTMGNCPLLYVRGNHDAVYDRKPPEGCVCIEEMIYNHCGLRVAGLGGSMRYKFGSNMYSEKEMDSRVNRLMRKTKTTGGIDILVTHAPVRGYGDLDDLPHRGFECFDRFLTEVKPLYMLHGHVHKAYSRSFEKRREHPSGTVIINAYESCTLDIPESAYPQFGNTGAFLYDFYCRNGKKIKGFDRNPI